MNLIFVHDHKFRKIGQQMYSPGGLPNDVLKRYADVFGNVKVIGRILYEERARETYSPISLPNVVIETNKGLEGKIKNSDVLIARLPSLNGYKAVHYAKKHNKPYLVEVVGCTFDAFWNHSLKGKIAAIPAYLYMRYCVSGAKYAVYVTNFFLQGRYPCKGITCGISDVSLQKCSPEVLSIRLDSINQGKKVIKIGTAASVDITYKGQMLVIKALKGIENKAGVRVEYQLAGSGNPSYLLKIAEEVGVKDRVKILGAIPHERIFNWLDELDLYVQPSKLEGLSRALIEAMSRGLPCVASNVGGNPELIEYGALFGTAKKKNSIENLEKCICRMLSEDEMSYQAQKNFQIANCQYSCEYLNKLRTKFYVEFREACVSDK